MRIPLTLIAVVLTLPPTHAHANRLLKGIKPEDAKPKATEGFRPNLQKLKVELGLLNYVCFEGMQKANGGAEVLLAPLFRGALVKTVACIESDQRHPASEEYERCLQAAFADLYALFFLAAYPSSAARLCPEPVVQGPPPPVPGSDPAAKIEEALALLRDNQTSRAEPMLDEGIGHFTRQMGGRPDRYICATTDADLQKILATSPERKGAYPIHAAYCEGIHAKAQLLARKKDYEKALELLELEAPLRPGNAEVLVARGETLAQLSRFRDAAHVFEQALRTVPMTDAYTRSRVLLGFAAAQVGLGNYTAARKAAEESLRLDPSNPTAKDELHYIDTLDQQRREQKKKR